MQQKMIVFYDGECGFCNRTVQFILKKDKRGEIFFAALQSGFSESFFNERGLPTPDLDTFYFYNGVNVFDRSTGILRVLKVLPLPWKCLFGFIVFPRPLRDAVYNFVAKRRKRIAGDFCVIPDTDQKMRFLDQL